MNGRDWNGNGHTDDFDKYVDYKASGSDKNDYGYKPSVSDQIGCGWGVIVIVAFMLISFIFSGASWDAIEGLLSWGLIAFFVVRFLFN